MIWVFNIPDFLLPKPHNVIVTLYSESSFFRRNTLETVQTMLIGATSGITIGVFVGLTLALYKPIRWIVEPYLLMFQSFPRESLAPLIVVWLGFGQLPKIAFSGLLAFFPIALITLNGLIDTRKDYIELIRSMGASNFEEIMHCRLPALVPSIITGLKVALPLALIGTVLGEFMGGNVGLGYIIITSGSAFRTDRIFAAIVCLAFIGIVMLLFIHLMQNYFFKRFNQEKQ